MAIIDIIFIAIIGISALRCAVRGLVSELLSMAAVVFGLLAAVLFFRSGALLVREQFMPEVKAIPEIIAFAAIFLAVFVIIKILEIMLKHIIEGIRLGGIDRLLGFLFGLAEGLIIVCLFLFLMSIQSFIDTDLLLGNSIFAEILLPLIMGIREELPESLVWLWGRYNGV
ncbi:MAG: CvpA family protein [Treponema sp.]|nr:CvpA family protein [Treponema sp.]